MGDVTSPVSGGIRGTRAFGQVTRRWIAAALLDLASIMVIWAILGSRSAGGPDHGSSPWPWTPGVVAFCGAVLSLAVVATAGLARRVRQRSARPAYLTLALSSLVLVATMLGYFFLAVTGALMFVVGLPLSTFGTVARGHTAPSARTPARSRLAFRFALLGIAGLSVAAFVGVAFADHVHTVFLSHLERGRPVVEYLPTQTLYQQAPAQVVVFLGLLVSVVAASAWSLVSRARHGSAKFGGSGMAAAGILGLVSSVGFGVLEIGRYFVATAVILAIVSFPLVPGDGPPPLEPSGPPLGEPGASGRAGWWRSAHEVG